MSGVTDGDFVERQEATSRHEKHQTCDNDEQLEHLNMLRKRCYLGALRHSPRTKGQSAIQHGLGRVKPNKTETDSPRRILAMLLSLEKIFDSLGSSAAVKLNECSVKTN